MFRVLSYEYLMSLCSRNLLVTFSTSDPSRCGAVRMLTWMAWLAQLSRHLVRVGSLSSQCCANFDVARVILLGTLPVSDRSRCGTVRTLTSRATPAALRGPDRLRNLLGTLCGSDLSCCGMVLILPDSLKSW